MLYEALGLCEQGQGPALLDSGRWSSNCEGVEQCRLGGQWVINASVAQC